MFKKLFFNWLMCRSAHFSFLFVFLFFAFPFLVRADSISGRVVGFDRVPIVGVTVYLEGVDPYTVLGTCTTDSDGYFAWVDYPVDVFNVISGAVITSTFSKSGYIGAIVTTTSVDECKVSIPETMLQKGSGAERHLYMEFVDQSYSPIVDAKVRIRRVGDYAAVSYTDGNGQCFFDRLREKSYTVTFTHPDFQTWKSPIDLPNYVTEGILQLVMTPK